MSFNTSPPTPANDVQPQTQAQTQQGPQTDPAPDMGQAMDPGRQAFDQALQQGQVIDVAPQAGQPQTHLQTQAETAPQPAPDMGQAINPADQPAPAAEIDPYQHLTDEERGFLQVAKSWQDGGYTPEKLIKGMEFADLMQGDPEKRIAFMQKEIEQHQIKSGQMLPPHLQAAVDAQRIDYDYALELAKQEATQQQQFQQLQQETQTQQQAMAQAAEVALQQGTLAAERELTDKYGQLPVSSYQELSGLAQQLAQTVTPDLPGGHRSANQIQQLWQKAIQAAETFHPHLLQAGNTGATAPAPAPAGNAAAQPFDQNSYMAGVAPTMPAPHPQQMYQPHQQMAPQGMHQGQQQMYQPHQQQGFATPTPNSIPNDAEQMNIPLAVGPTMSGSHPINDPSQREQFVRNAFSQALGQTPPAMNGF